MTIEIRGSLVDSKPVFSVLLLAHLIAQCLQFSIERMDVELREVESSDSPQDMSSLQCYYVCYDIARLPPHLSLLGGSLSRKECRLGKADLQPKAERGSSQPM